VLLEFLIYNLIFSISGVRSQESGVRSQESGVRSQESVKKVLIGLMRTKFSNPTEYQALPHSDASISHEDVFGIRYMVEVQEGFAKN